MGQGGSVVSTSGIKELTAIKDDVNTVEVSINDILYQVSKDIPIHTTLNTFIREVVNLKGTKAMCHEGGCGACIVAAEIKGEIMSVNSCLVPIYNCDGWKITTIEGVGNRKTGYHTLQMALAEMNGSQCGYCSPAWVMTMYSLMQNGKLTMKEVENSFAGNLCRCTGYRPILDTFKSFATDAPPVMQQKIKDIEELYKIKSCKNCPRKTCNGTCKDIEIIYESSIPRSLTLNLRDNTQFFTVLSIGEVFSILDNKSPNDTYIINGGNTGHGVYRVNNVSTHINVNNVPELHKITKEDKALTLGGNLSLSKTKKCFEQYMNESGFKYLKVLAEHIDLVASIPIRNIGTIAGNLMIKRQHPDFHSDIFLIFETAGADIHILDSPSSKHSMTLLEFLQYEMQKRLIYSIVLPAIDDEIKFKTYKMMPRAQNAHAIVNAGFLFKLNAAGIVSIKPNIIFGGINPGFFHASNTEAFLVGKSIFSKDVLKKALNILQTELQPDYVLPNYKPEFRKLLAVSFLYKFILSINPGKVNPKLKSGATMLSRGLSSGKQDYDTDRTIWPLNEPLPKIGAIYQTSGEAEYVGDIVMKDKPLYCAVTIADTIGKIQGIDTSEALAIDGVIAFYSAKDIPGKNLIVDGTNNFVFLKYDEILFAEKEITYAGQIYGVVVATSQKLAQSAASKIKIVYPKGPKQKPLITVHDVIAIDDKKRMVQNVNTPATSSPGTDIAHNIKGTYECGSQYHFTMESQTCVCIPIEDGMDVFPATQSANQVQTMIAEVLNVPINSINVKVRRVGGAYGAKLSRSLISACICALACHHLNHPMHLVMSIEDSMRSVGKRFNCYMEYELNCNKQGKIQSLDVSYWGNSGSSFNELLPISVMTSFYNCYDHSTWSALGYTVLTDVPSNTWCRAPNTTEGTASIETLMDRIAEVTNQDPIEVRLLNMNDTDRAALKPMIEKIKKTSDYDKRRQDISIFNKENRWKKRGMSLVTMNFPLQLVGQFRSTVAIYAQDGTVSVSHSGIEMGQGINTKIAQIAAYTLGINLDMVTVKPNDNTISPNSESTGGSIGSDTCGYATLMACKKLKKRLEPIKTSLGGNPTWKDLVFAAWQKNIDLSAAHLFTIEQELTSYSIYGTAVAEVEVDMLTGQHLIRRVDILEDAGISLNPEIDVGQVEGAFVMGSGFWTFEDLMYDPETGNLTNYRTWNYKVPGVKDIPIDFRVSFNRKEIKPYGVLRSKAIGEPPFCLSCSVPLAIRRALNSARADAGNTDLWYQLDNNLTAEKILLNSLTDVRDMVL